jgi:TRAP transporter 4TM/12TM fusion protein
MAQVVRFFAIVMSLYHLLYIADFFDLFGLMLYGAHRGMSLAFILTLCFLVIPATKKAPRDRLPWYDIVLIVLSLVPTLYYFYRYEDVVYFFSLPSSTETAIGIMLLIASLEAARRVIGWPMVVIGGSFILYPLFAERLPGILFADANSFQQVMGTLFFSYEGVFGVAMEIFATVVAVFIIFGEAVRVSGAGDFFLKLGLATMGRFRGGPAKAAVTGSAAFGTISGIAVANVVTTGSITIPLMKRTGYKPHFAAAVEAVASTGGAIMPPVMGIIAFIMAEVLEVSYWSIVVAAVFPAILYYIAVYMQVDFEAAKTGLRGLARSEIPSFWATLKEGWYFAIPVAVLLYVLAIMGYTPVKAGLYSLISLIAVSFFRKETRMGPTKILSTLEGGAVGLARIGPVGAIVGIIMGGTSLTALGLRFSAGLVDMSGGNLFFLLLLAAAASLLMGLAISLIVTYLVLAILVAPALIDMGILPLAAHLFLLYYATVGLITPPVCIAAYAAAGIAQSDPFRTGFQATRLGIIALIVPFMFVYNPALIMQGTAGEIALVVVTAVLGVVALAGALEGYLLRGAQWWERILLGGGGLALIFPGLMTDLMGAAAIGLALIGQLIALRAGRPAVVVAEMSTDPPAPLQDTVPETKEPFQGPLE